MRTGMVRAAAFAFLVAATGCGGGGATMVKGKVTLDGAPVGDALVTFYSSKNLNVGAFSATSKDDGSFETLVDAETKLDEGEYRVTVTKAGLKKDSKMAVNPEGVDMQQLKMMGQAVNTLPKVYERAQATPLTALVKRGEVTADLALKGK